ncbi:MAG: Cof-type HAD-IIB family hydrolase [Clostridia bacterium]|nr:Cof-type HAD-IIB family hydrolase [Clostridia bacterium]
MYHSNIKLIALDLDGTLLGSDSLVHESERQALQQARQNGVSIVLCTGRSVHDSLPHAQAAGGVDWIITENGARITSSDGETIYRHPLSVQHLKLLLELCEVHHVEPSFYGESCVWYGEQCRAFFDEIYRTTGRMPPIDMGNYRYIETREQWHMLAEKTVYKSIVYGDIADLDSWMQDMQETGAFESEPSIFCGLKNIEINAKGTNKGTALLYLAEHLGLTRKQVMACGDSDNDRKMLQAAGLGVAMRNAPAHIQNIANVVTDTNELHGVAKAIQNYVL